MWGTSFGQPVTVSFWFRTNAPSGSSMNICIRSAAFNVNFNQNYTALGNGQWQYVTLTIPPPPNGTSWATFTTLYLGGLQPAQTAATPGWSSTGNNWGLNGTYPWAQNAGNYIEMTGIQLEKGTVATPFEFRNYAQELALCQRYYYATSPGTPTGAAVGTVGDVCFNSVGTFNTGIRLPVPMRIAAWTLAIYNNGVANQFRNSSNGGVVTHTGTLTIFGNQSTTGAAGFYYTSGTELAVGTRYDFDYVVNAEL